MQQTDNLLISKLIHDTAIALMMMMMMIMILIIIMMMMMIIIIIIIINIDRQLISEEGTFLWLPKGHLKAETESEIVAAQDQALQTKYYATKILSTERDSKCRLTKNLMKL